MGDRRKYLINNIVRICQKLDNKGFGANHDGNVSVRFEDVLLATPTAVSKADIVPEIIITLGLDGKKIEGIGNPFSEIQLHLAAYNSRDDVKAVVHAHPPYATARGLTGDPMIPALPEAIVSIGDIIPVVQFAMPGDKNNIDIIADALSSVDTFMMPGNGVLAVGPDLETAYLRLELVEHLAKIDLLAKQMGEPMKLANENMSKLLQKRASIGLGPKKASPAASPAKIDNSLRSIIADEINKILQGN